MSGVDELGGVAVLVGQPVVGQVQVDPRRLDRDVTGLGLDRLESHPGFSQSGQTGVAELVAGGPFESRSPSGGPHDDIDAVDTQSPSPARALQSARNPISPW